MARYYNPNVGRFVSEDPIADGPFDYLLPLSTKEILNLQIVLMKYTYAINNPTGFTDPTGLIEYKKAGPRAAGITILGVAGRCIVKDACEKLEKACTKLQKRCRERKNRQIDLGDPENPWIGTGDVGCFTEFKTCRLWLACNLGVRPALR
jgi:RHS repeat-associated protein